MHIFIELRRGITLAAILTIALGIGASTAIFSVAHTVLLKPLSYRDPGQLVVISERNPPSHEADRLSPATARDLLARSRTIEAIALYSDGGGGRMIANGEAEILRGQRVSGNFFETLGIRAQLGRVFSAADSLPGRDNDILLSYGLWMRRFGGDPAIVGRSLNLSGRIGRVVGVLPPEFHALHMSNPGEVPQVFQPLSIDALESEDRRPGFTNIARLKRGVPIRAAEAELAVLLHDLMRQHPGDYPRDAALTVQRLDRKLAGNVRDVLWALLAAVALVLLIMCANVANMLLTRAHAREKEMAIRGALGASRFRLVREIFAESPAISGCGGFLGVLLAWVGISALAAFAPAEIPRVDEIRIDFPVLMFALTTSILSAAFFSVAPAFRVTRADLSELIRGAAAFSVGRTSGRARRVLVVCQIACAFVLTASAALLARSVNDLVHLNAGYDPHNILTLTTLIYDDSAEQKLHHYQEMVARVRAIPGVEEAAMVSTVPLSPPVQNSISVEDRTVANADATLVDEYFATPNYFRLMKIPLHRGRSFSSLDRLGAAPVAVLSESSARVQFAGRDPIGKRIRLGTRDGDGHVEWTTIVGIVGDVRQHGMDQAPGMGVYLPQSQHPDFYYRLLVRTAGDPRLMLPAVRRALHEIDPNQAIFHAQPMDGYITKSLAGRIFGLSLTGLLGSLAIFLAVIGVYGVVSYAVSLRTREIGIRMAIGADRLAVLRLVMSDVLAMIYWGLSVGLLIALSLSRLLAHVLFHVNAMDAVVTVTAALVLACVALAAGFVPCLRALSVNPSTALRCC